MGSARKIALGLVLIHLSLTAQVQANTWSRWQRWRWTYWANAGTRSFWINPEATPAAFPEEDSNNPAARNPRNPQPSSQVFQVPTVVPSPLPMPDVSDVTPPFHSTLPTPPDTFTALPPPSPVPPPTYEPITDRFWSPEPVAPPSIQADAYLNMSDGPYPQAGMLTTGSAQPWYLSPVTQRLFGGTPDPAQREAFTQSVLNRVENVYARHGVPLAITTNPATSAAHTLSVVSNTSYAGNPQAIGISDLGRNGFTFVDKLDQAQSVDELAWAVANNVAHELMHTFGVEHHDTSGAFLDAAITPWSVLVDPNVQFSPAAVADLLAQDFRAVGGSLDGSTAAMLANKACQCLACGQAAQSILPAPVPEPATLILWSLPLALGYLAHRRKNRQLP